MARAADLFLEERWDLAFCEREVEEVVKLSREVWVREMVDFRLAIVMSVGVTGRGVGEVRGLNLIVWPEVDISLRSRSRYRMRTFMSFSENFFVEEEDERKGFGNS